MRRICWRKIFHLFTVPWSVEPSRELVTQSLKLDNGDFVGFFGVVELLSGEMVAVLVDESGCGDFPVHVVVCLDIFLLEENIFYEVREFCVRMEPNNRFFDVDVLE